MSLFETECEHLGELFAREPHIAAALDCPNHEALHLAKPLLSDELGVAARHEAPFPLHGLDEAGGFIETVQARLVVIALTLRLFARPLIEGSCSPSESSPESIAAFIWSSTCSYMGLPLELDMMMSTGSYPFGASRLGVPEVGCRSRASPVAAEASVGRHAPPLGL